MKKKMWPKSVLSKLVPVCSFHHLAAALKFEMVEEDGIYLMKIETCQYCKDLFEAKGVSVGNRMRQTIDELKSYSGKLEKAYKKSTRT